MITSMTGFASTGLTQSGYRVSIEAKSLNAKGLDVRVRVPAMLDGLDLILRKQVQARFRRGNIALTVAAERDETTEAMQVNYPLLDQLLTVAHEQQRKWQDASVSIDGLLAVRGVVDHRADTLCAADRNALETAIVKGLGTVLDQLSEMRGQEGAALSDVISDQLDGLEILAAAATERAAVQSGHIPARLRALLDKLNSQDIPVSEDRIAQEVALLLVRGDVTEELDRLAVHLKAARGHLTDPDPVGRQFDFLCQELNREANTLCSKAQDQQLTDIGLKMKVTIDQIREQVQNIE